MSVTAREVSSTPVTRPVMNTAGSPPSSAPVWIHCSSATDMDSRAVDFSSRLFPSQS